MVITHPVYFLGSYITIPKAVAVIDVAHWLERKTANRRQRLKDAGPAIDAVP